MPFWNAKEPNYNWLQMIAPIWAPSSILYHNKHTKRKTKTTYFKGGSAP